MSSDLLPATRSHHTAAQAWARRELAAAGQQLALFWQRLALAVGQQLAEQLALLEGDQVTDDAGRQTQRDVRRVGERGRHLVNQHIAGDAAADAAEQLEHDAHHGEVAAVVRSAGQQRPVASVGRPTSATLLPWKTYRMTIEHDIVRWNAVNADPGNQNAGQRISMLIAWTVDDEDELRCLIRIGVAGIITNSPELLAKLLGR